MVASRSASYWLWIFAAGLAASCAACSKKREEPGPKNGSDPQAKPDSSSGQATPGVSKPSTPDGTSTAPSPQRPPNFLLFIADDLGIDVLKSSGFTKNPARTPNLDRMAEAGIVFDNFWVTPACTTTRGALISGLHGFRSGIDHVPAVMPAQTATIQQWLKTQFSQSPYRTGIFGKWHLGGAQADPDHPRAFGVEPYAGNIFNLDDYFQWTLTENGQQREVSGYHTTMVVDLARDFISAQPQNQPWFAWVAFAAPHSPFHRPPDSLITSTLDESNSSLYAAMVEAMDTEIGRLVSGLSPEQTANTVVIFLGDNGTPRGARDREIFAADHVKNSIYEGGIRAPLIFSGARVSRSGARESAMVNATDLFATLAELARGSGSATNIPEHSVSFAPLLVAPGPAPRSFNYSEWKDKGESYWAFRDASYKLIVFPDGSRKLFEVSDVSETNALQDRAVEEKLFEMGSQFRAGELSPQDPKPGARSCVDFAGTRSHKAQDVGESSELSGEITISVAGDTCTIRTNGIPNHDFNDGKSSFPNPVSAQDYLLSVPVVPRQASDTTDLSIPYDDGILLDGAKIDVLAAACFGVGDGKIGCNDMNQPWRYDPVFRSNGFRVDQNLAHTQASGAYHYHGVGGKFPRVGVIGIAADGFLIHSASVESQGSSRVLRPSYRLRSGARQRKGDANAPFPGGNYDGTYRDDWEYVAGHGELDECNGMVLDGQYMYFATEAYPYFMACFRGTPDPSFRKRGNGGWAHAHGHYEGHVHSHSHSH